MLTLELVPYVLESLWLYILVLAMVSLGYYLILRRYVFSIIDPLFLYFIFSAFGFAIVTFMWLKGLIESRYFISYLSTQFAFIFGLRIFKRTKKPTLDTVYDDSSYSRLPSSLVVSYYIASFLLVAITVSVFAVNGIPLFYESRLSYYQSDAGFGFFSRVQYACTLLSAYVLIVRISSNTPRSWSTLYDFSFLAFLIVAGVLSGAKSGLLFLTSIYFYVIFFQRARSTPSLKNDSRLTAKLVLIVFGSAIVTSLFSSSVNTLLIDLVNRFVFSGDVYIFSYPKNVIEEITRHNPFLVIFQDFLGLTRIVSWSELPVTPGIELYKLLDSSAGEVGPNPRHNMFGYVYFGFYGSILYSFILGIILGFIRISLPNMLPNTAYGGLVFVSLAIAVSALEIDVGMVIGNLDNIIFFMTPILIFSVLVSFSARRKRMEIC